MYSFVKLFLDSLFLFGVPSAPYSDFCQQPIYLNGSNHYKERIQVLFFFLSFFFPFFFIGGAVPDIQKFWGQGLNSSHISDSGHSSEVVGSLTHCTTKGTSSPLFSIPLKCILNIEEESTRNISSRTLPSCLQVRFLQWVCSGSPPANRCSGSHGIRPIRSQSSGVK